MKHTIKLFILVFLLSNTSSAQSINNLLKKLETSKDSAKVEVLNQLAEAYAMQKVKPKKNSKVNEPDLALEYGTKALKYAEEIKYEKGIAASYFTLGKLYLQKKNYRDAELAFLNSVELAKKLKEHDLVLKNYEYTYQFHKELGNSNNAVAYANFKSEYKNVIIKELKASNEEVIESLLSKQEEIDRLNSLIKAKEAKIKEGEKALARIPEKVKVIEYQKVTDYKLVAIAIVLFVLLLVWHLAVKKRKQTKIDELYSKYKIAEKKLKDAYANYDGTEKFERSSKMENALNAKPLEGPSNEIIKTRQLLSQASFIIQKNEILLKLKDNFEKLKESKVGEFSSHVLEINELINVNYNAEKDWEEFVTYFESAHPRYVSKVKEKYPAITEAELKMIVLKKANLTAQEMSSILHLSEREIERVFQELNTKLKKENA